MGVLKMWRSTFGATRIEKEGLTPDIVVQPVEGSDAELAAAVEFLSSDRPAVSDNP